MRIVLLIVAVLLTGCSAPLMSFRLSEDVTMDVDRMYADDESFDVRIDFTEHSEEHEYLIQEGDLGFVFFVECWKTTEDGEIRGYDHQWAEDLGAAPMLVREFKVYTGTVAGADLTKRQSFAMLPQNIDGSVVTNVDPRYFNYDNYFSLGHRIQGRVVEQAQVVGTWRLIWTPNTVRVDTEHGYIVWSDGAVLIFEVEQ